MQLMTMRSQSLTSRLKPVLTLGLISTLFALTLACGHKAMPILPNMGKPLAVKNLAQKNVNGRLTLTFQVASGEDLSALDHFLVLRSKMKLSPTLCKTCPLPFDQVAEIDFYQPQGNNYTYQETLDKGYWYAFKVIAVNSNRTAGSESGIVKFEY